MLKEKHGFHELERLRNLLLDEVVRYYDEQKHFNGYVNENEPVNFLDDSAAIRVIISEFPEVDQNMLKNTAMQFARTRNRKHSRELFRILKAAMEKAQFSQKQG